MMGKTPVQETRGFNPNNNQTFSQRTKESAEDYRYFPDPDLPPIRFTQEEIDTWQNELPVMPEEKVEEWQEKYGVEPRYGELLFETVTGAEWMEQLFEVSSK
jgi:aspartyl-tRNA(Asn)/glutamyl-tRNA(Gln) amidotransferase subunit B